MPTSSSRKLLIIVGGGPAPGINSVIAAAVREASKLGWHIFGAIDGYKGIRERGSQALQALNPQEVSVVANNGGSLLGTSKVDPSSSEESKNKLLDILRSENISDVITIGGEGSLTISHRLYSDSPLRVVHVPKTIDNDLPLPGLTSTFGFQTAREAGSKIVQALLTDARSTKRYYVAVTQGRDAGHLALGIGLSSGASLTLIPELFTSRNSVSGILDEIVGCMAGTVLKRHSMNKYYGAIVVAEGLLHLILQDPELKDVELQRDPHGNVRFSEIDFSGILKRKLRARLEDWGLPTDVVNHDIGYELRSVPPNAFDREYTIQLGYGAVQLLAQDQSLVMVTRDLDRLVPLPFAKLLDISGNCIRTRCVDIGSETYRIARQYMSCIETEDLTDSKKFDALSRLTKKSQADLKTQLQTVHKTLSANVS